PGDPAGGIVETHVVAFDPHGRSVQPTLVGDAVGVTGVEQLAPAAAAGRDVVPEEITRRLADQLGGLGPELLRHRRVDLGHALMGIDAVPHGALTYALPPLLRMMKHHDEERLLRALEELRE